MPRKRIKAPTSPWYIASDDELRSLVNRGYRVRSHSRQLHMLAAGRAPTVYSSRKEVARVFSIGKHSVRRAAA